MRSVLMEKNKKIVTMIAEFYSFCSLDDGLCGRT